MPNFTSVLQLSAAFIWNLQGKKNCICIGIKIRFSCTIHFKHRLDPFHCNKDGFYEIELSNIISLSLDKKLVSRSYTLS